MGVIQRVFWAFTEGGVASALLVAGGRNSLKALQAASICAGLPYTIMLCIMCTALWRMLKEHSSDPNAVWVGPDRKNGPNDPKPAPAFKMDLCGGIFELVETAFSFGRTSKTLVPEEAINTVVACACPAVGVLQVLTKINPEGADGVGGPHTTFGSQKAYNLATAGTAGLLYYLFIIFMFVEFAEDGFWALGWTAYVFFAFVLAAVRTTAREAHGICGNALKDFFAALFAFPQVIAQIQSGSLAEANAAAGPVGN